MGYQSLYFVAIPVPEPLAGQITEIKNDFSKRFNSNHALKTAPHITLKSPFTIEAHQHDDLSEWFDNLSLSIQPFTQVLNGFGAFEKKDSPVIFVHPEMSEPLQQLQQQVLHSFRDTFREQVIMAPDWKFKPHITIAHRDLTPDSFTDAWDEFREKTFTAAFTVDRIELLRHDRRKWTAVAARNLS